MGRVLVTGIGLCAPLEFEQVIAGQCGLVQPDWSVPGVAIRVGRVAEEAEVGVRALPGGWRPDRLDPFSWFALLAAERARRDSGLTDSRALEWAGVVLASAMGGEQTHDRASQLLAEAKETGKRARFSPFTAPKLMPNAASANVALLLGAHGPNVSPAAACASGGYALAQGADLIRLGRAQVVFAGATEAPCEEIAARVFAAGDALSPSGTALPFHRNRDGFVLAEGAAILVLEEEGHARRRGARVYAELAGAGLTCDAHHVVAPQPEGRYAAQAMRLALAEAGVAPEGVGYVNAHATGTSLGDAAECRAIREVFGATLPLVSSTKGATGHLLGAAGALEAAYAVEALRTGRIPPTFGLDSEAVDPDCAAGGLDFVGETGREAALQAVLTNSFAFGGHNVCLLFRAT